MKNRKIEKKSEKKIEKSHKVGKIDESTMITLHQYVSREFRVLNFLYK